MNSTFEIKRVKNGIVLTHKDSDESIVFQQDCQDEFEAWQIFLNTLTSDFGPEERGRYSEKRIFAVIRHGDKYECTKKDCSLC